MVAQLAENDTPDNPTVAKLAQKLAVGRQIYSRQFAHTTGSHEVTGSTPVFSTIKTTIYGGFLLSVTYILWLSNICQEVGNSTI